MPSNPNDGRNLLHLPGPLNLDVVAGEDAERNLTALD